jgi:hypothetical protein
MPPAPLTPTNRYFPPAKRKIYWLTTCSNYNAPTRGELNAGTDLSAEIAAVAGYSLTDNPVDTPDMGSRFTSQVPGRQTAAGSSLTIYCDQVGNDARALLLNGVAGFVVCLWEGDTTGFFMDVFPARVDSQAMDTTVDDPGQCVFSFTCSRVPAIRVLVP